MQNYNKFIKFINKNKYFEFISLDDVYLFEDKNGALKVVFLNYKNEFEIRSYNDFFNIYFENNKEFRNFIKQNDSKNFFNTFKLNFKMSKKIYKQLSFEVNLLLDKNEIIESESDELKLVYSKILTQTIDKKDFFKTLFCIKNKNIFDLNDYKKYIKLYKKEHFAELDDVIDFLVINLFNNNRKQSFLNIVTVSNWGKTQFLKEILEKINFGFTTTLELLTTSPSPLTKQDFLQKGCLIIDEFTVFKKELKVMDNSILLNPKNEKTLRIEVFGKLLLNKEQSPSFTNVVDEQIKNRVLLINKQNAKEIKLFLEKNDLNGDMLKKYLTFYYYNKINKKINFFKSLEYNDLQKKIQDITKKLEKKYGLGKYNTLSTEKYIKNTFSNFIINKIKQQDNKEEGTFIFGYKNDEYFCKYKLIDKQKEVYLININKFNKLLNEVLMNEDPEIYKSVRYSINNEGIFEGMKKRIQIKYNNINFRTTQLVVTNTQDTDTDTATLLDKKLKEIAELKQQLQQKNAEIEQLKTQIEFLEQQNRQLKVDNTITTLTKKQVQEIPHIHIEEELPF